MSRISIPPDCGQQAPTPAQGRTYYALTQPVQSNRGAFYYWLGFTFFLYCLWSVGGGHAVAQQKTADQSAWNRFTIDDSLRGADGVRLADANGDGLLDITTGWEESGQTRAYLHPGKQRVMSAWPRVTVGDSPSIEDAVWIDLNGDGHLDVLSCCEGREQSLRAHLVDPAAQIGEPDAWSTRVIEPSLGMTRWMFATPFPSVKHKGQPPTIVVGSKSPHGLVGLLDYSATTRQWTIHKLVDAEWIMSLKLLDIDDDHDLDILYTERKGKNSGVYWLENPQQDATIEQPSHVSTWAQHLIGARGQEVMFLTVVAHEAPLVGEKKSIDILVAVKPNHIYRFSYQSDPTSQSDPRQNWQPEMIEVAPSSYVGTAKGIASGDLDGDGIHELVFTCEGAVAPKSGVVYLKHNPQDSTWNLHDVSGPEGIKFDLVELVDLDRDGDLDILTCEERHAGRGLGVVWYANPLH